MYVDEHVRPLRHGAAEAWSRLHALGPDPRDYAPSPVWQVRDVVDRALGGPGFVWRVESADEPELHLRALSRLPGTARLALRVDPDGSGARLVVRSSFVPDGPLGHAYWWSNVVAHKLVFARMADVLARRVDSAPR